MKAVTVAFLLLSLLAVTAIDDDEAAPQVEKAIKVLTDKTFEHDTQASTGQTTGRWLVLFTGPDCKACAAVESYMEEVAAELGNLLLAKVDVVASPMTAKRFGLSSVPAVKLFRDRSMYSCTSCYATAADLKQFVEAGYKDAIPERAPPEPLALDEVREKIREYYGIAARFLERSPSAQLLVLALVCYFFYLGTLKVLRLVEGPKKRRKGPVRRTRKTD